MASKIYDFSDEEFSKIIQESISYSECLRKLGLGTSGGSSRDVLKKRIEELNLSTEHFNRKEALKKAGLKRTDKIPLDEILVENSTYANSSRLKLRLIQEGRLEYKCEICGISEWLGKPLSLQLDHKNGKNNDHRLENLRFLCPNCHSQTETYAGRNKKL